MWQFYACLQVRASVEEKEAKQFDKFVAVKYCTQVVAGVNYFIKVLITPYFNRQYSELCL